MVMFAEAFQNELTDGYFNKSLTHKLADSVEKTMERFKFYVKSEEINAKKEGQR